MIQWLDIESNALKDFPMGDAHRRKFPVYLPPNYSDDSSEAFDVIYLLAGYGDYASKYVWKSTAFSKSLPEQLDDAISTAKIPPVIMVFPDCNTKLGCSQYINSPTLGNYMDYLCDEVTTLVDNRYNTFKSAKRRGIMGHSSGGYGALVTGMQRPDIFSNICSSAGDSFFELLFLPLIPRVIHDVTAAGGVAKFVEQFFKDPGMEFTDKVMTMMMLCMAGCFAPNPENKVIFGDLFFDLQTGKIDEAIWQRYLQWDPVRMVDTHLDALRQLNCIHLDCGLQDQFGMQWGHRQIAEKLRGNNIACELNEYPGSHMGQDWRVLSRIEKMLGVMRKD